MGQPIQQGTGQPGIAKDLGPFGEGQIGGHDQRVAQVLLAAAGELAAVGRRMEDTGPGFSDISPFLLSVLCRPRR